MEKKNDLANMAKAPIFRDENGKEIQVPVEGSLGLLALGWQGLFAWREARKKANYSFKEHLFIPSSKKPKNG